MIRYCHPQTPVVGLCRQSRDPSLTLQYYREANKKRDRVCFHKMLRTMTRRIRAYHLLQGFWLKAIRSIGCPYLACSIVEFIRAKVDKIPRYFIRFHEIHMKYTTLNAPRRFKQMIGRLVSLGFPDRPIPEIDYEYEAYLSKFPPTYHPMITDLYRQLCYRKIPNKWHILLSYLPNYLQFDYSGWTYYKDSNQLQFMLDACHRQHKFSPQEYQIMLDWIGRMKYPSD